MNTTPAPPLRVEGVTKRFRQGSSTVEALKDVTLTVQPGEFVAVMGASGSGKSTLLHVMAGLTRPDEGRVRVEGEDIGGLPDRKLTRFRRRRIGLVFQAFNLIPTLTAEDNVRLPLLTDGRPEAADGKLDPLLARLGIADRRAHRPDALSGGEQQRVAIARALVTDPAIVLADEPTGSLDSVTGQGLCRLLKELCGAPVNGAPPLGPTLVGTDAADPPYPLTDGAWFDTVHTDRPEGVLTSGAAKRLNVGVGGEVVVTSRANQVRVTVVGIVEQPPAAPAGGPRGGGGGSGDGNSEKGGGGPPGGGRGGKGGGKGNTKGGGPPGGGGGGPPGASGPATNALFVSIPLAEKINGYPFRANVISVALKDGVSVGEFRAAWEKRLAESYPVVRVTDFEDVKARLSSDRAVAGKRTQAYSATGIALMAAVFIIFTTLSMGVSERARELAVLRAVALTRSQVVLLVAAESLLLAVIGWLGGLGAGWVMLELAGRAQPDLFPNGASLRWWCVALTGAAAFGGALLAAVIPAWRATRVSPLDAMAPPRPRPVGTWPVWAAAAGVLLLTINPVVVYAIDVPDENRPLVYAGLGYPSMVLGFLLLAPLAVVLVEKYLGRVVARLLLLDPRLVASQLSGNMWRTLGTTVALTVGLGLYVATQTWGASMLRPFYPGDWLPDMVVAFQPSGVPDSEVEAVRRVPGVNPDRCLPLAVEQPKLAKDLTNSAARTSATRQDNVVLIGLDPGAGFGGDSPLLKLDFVAGDRAAAVEKLKAGRHCLVPDHFANIAGLKVGDPVGFVPPNDPRNPVEYRVAGVVSIPGWHWVTKFSGVRRNFTRTAAMVFAPFDDVRRDFKLDGVQFFWLNGNGTATPKEVEAGMQAVAERHAGGTFYAPGVGRATAYKPTVKVTATETVRAAITRRADGMIWGMSQIPLLTLAVTSIAVVGTVAASVRARRWEMGVLRSTGVTRSGLFRLILGEAFLIGLVVCALSLGFGVMAGWCGTGMARYAGFFGGMDTSLVIPWAKVGLGLGAALGLCLLAALWPAVSAGRAEPLKLLQAGRATM